MVIPIHFTFEPLNFSTGAICSAGAILVSNHYLARRRGKEGRQARALEEARLKFGETLNGEMNIFRKDIRVWPKATEESLLDAVASVRPRAEIYCALLSPEDSALFRRAWRDLVTFCDQKHSYQDYQTAKWYKNMGPREDLAETLVSHIERLLTLAGQPPLR